jgi:hypothetical protein
LKRIPSRAVLDAWDQITRLLTVATIMLIIGMAGVPVGWACACAVSVIADGLQRIQQGDLAFRLPQAARIRSPCHRGCAFNRMAQAVEDKVQAERKALEAETSARRAARRWRTSSNNVLKRSDD